VPFDCYAEKRKTFNQKIIMNYILLHVHDNKVDRDAETREGKDDEATDVGVEIGTGVEHREAFASKGEHKS